MKKLNLGCGEKQIKGYINIDINPECKPDLVCDVRKLPYEKGEVDEVLALDLLEHFGRNETLLVLKEWNRVLKKGGELIIKCPNLEKIATAYLGKRCKDPLINGLNCARILYGNQDILIEQLPLFLREGEVPVKRPWNNPFTKIPGKYDFHKNAFDKTTINFYLTKAGFKIKEIKDFSDPNDWKNMLVVAEK